MINSIIERHSRLNPLSETEIKIVRSATEFFLTKGYSKTTFRMISADTGIGLGTITYHYRAKEDLLRLLVEELMDRHLDVIDEAEENAGDKLLAYAIEIALQIALCESDAMAYDLYYSAYRHPAIFEYIKLWAAKKNYHLLKDRLPNLTENDFRNIEDVTSGIELAAFNSVKDRYFTLDDKIRLFLDSMMKVYDISETERKVTIDKVLSLDYEKMAKEMFSKFVSQI